VPLRILGQSSAPYEHGASSERRILRHYLLLDRHVRLQPVETFTPVRGRLNNAMRFFMTFAYQKVILLAAEMAVPNPPTFGARNYPRESWEVPRF
jgi:hypothetical protein